MNSLRKFIFITGVLQLALLTSGCMTSYVLDQQRESSGLYTLVSKRAQIPLERAVLYLNIAQSAPVKHYLELHYLNGKDIPQEVSSFGNPVMLAQETRFTRVYPPPAIVSSAKANLHLSIRGNRLFWDLRLKPNDTDTIFLSPSNKKFTHEQPVVLPDDIHLREDYVRYELTELTQIPYVIYRRKSSARRAAENIVILPFTLTADIITLPIQLGVGILVMRDL